MIETCEAVRPPVIAPKRTMCWSSRRLECRRDRSIE